MSFQSEEPKSNEPKIRSAGPPPLPRVQPPPIPKAPPIPQKRSTLLKQQDLDAYKNLLVFAQTLVDGYFSGKHKSPDHGSNAEFAEHTQYYPGLDVSQIDWRVYARTKKLFVRRYEDETDMVIYLLVDISKSMSYQGTGKEFKYNRAARIAAALTYLMVRQGDKVSLTLFNDQIRDYLPPGGTRRHLFDVINTLEKRIDTVDGGTGIANALQQCGDYFKKRGRIVLLSDLHTDLDELFDALGQFSHRNFDILLLHVLDPDEVNLPDIDLANFVDMETGENIQVEPDEIRSAYTLRMKNLVDDLQTRSSENRIQYRVLNTEQPYIEAIEAYLGVQSK